MKASTLKRLACSVAVSIALTMLCQPIRAYSSPTAKIKNGRPINVLLGGRRAPALGILPDNGVWKVVFGPDLAGSTIELEDVTPGATYTKWVLSLAEGPLFLDTTRFIPTHVYDVAVRKDNRTLGTNLIYLYPPAFRRVSRVKFQPDEQDTRGDARPSRLSTVPKSSL